MQRWHAVVAWAGMVVAASCGSKGQVTEWEPTPSAKTLSLAAPIPLSDHRFVLPLFEDRARSCDESRCPAVMTLVRDRLFASTGSAIKALLTRLDGRLNDLRKESEGHELPCLEWNALESLWPTPDGSGIKLALGCRSDYEPGANEGVAATIAFGQDATGFTAVDQLTYNDQGTRTVLMRRQGSYLDAWVIAVRGKNALREGAVVVSHVEADDKKGTFSYRTAAGPDANSGMGCGVIVEGTRSYIYATGQYGDESAAADANCRSLSERRVCLATEDLSVVSEEACEDSGLGLIERMTTRDVDEAAMRHAVGNVFTGVPDFVPYPIVDDADDSTETP